MDPLEAVAALFGAAGVWLTAKEVVWCWPVGLVNVLLYAIVFTRAKLYADAGLQVVYAVLCAVGFWQWLRGGAGGTPLAVARTPRPLLAGLLVAGALASVGLGFLLRKETDAAVPYWDASLTSFSLVAQALQTRKWLESWMVWIVVDTLYVGLFVARGLRLTAVLYAVFLVLAVIGLREWRRSLLRAAA